MANTRRVGILLLTIILIATAITCYIQPVEAASTTDVNLRMVIKYSNSYAMCNVTLKRYESMTSNMEIIDDSFKSSFTIRRMEDWEYLIKLEPGFYQVDYVGVPGMLELELTGYSQRFEVKGDKMTVYVAVDNVKDPVKMPDNWLVYGEDEQDFHIWQEQEVTTPTTPTEPNNTAPTLPTVDTESEEDPDTPSRPTAPANTESNTSQNIQQEEKSASAKVGDILFMIIIIAGLIVCSFVLLYLKKQRGA